VLVLPNSPNVVMAAERAAGLAEREVVVADCTSQQAGLVALVELDPDAEVEINAARIAEAVTDVRTGAVAPAARDDAEGRFVRGDAVGFNDGEIVAWGGAGTTLAATIQGLAEDAEIVTIIEGQGAPIALDEVTGLAPDGVDVEAHTGGQPHYWWLLAAQ
jgi:hypothetical protein